MIRNTRIFLFFFGTLLLTSFRPFQNGFFEGLIVYNISAESDNAGFNPDNFTQSFGIK
jgi:hypothetical protein